MPEVTVIIPTWNRSIDVQQAVESVLKQTYQDFEILVADDGSTDNTSKIFSEYPDSRVRYLQLAHSGLPAVVRNAALHESHGKWIAFLDSDDIWLPEKLQTQINIILASPNIGLVCSNAWRDTGKKDSQNLFHPNTLTSQTYGFERLIQSNLVIASSTLVKKEILDALGGFPVNRIYRAVEDYHLWLSVVLQSELYYIAEPLLIYKDDGDSIRSLQSREDNVRGLLQIYNDLVSLTAEQIIPYRDMIDIRRENYLKLLLGICTDQGKLVNWIRDAFRFFILKFGYLSLDEYRWLGNSLIQLIKNKIKSNL